MMMSNYLTRILILLSLVMLECYYITINLIFSLIIKINLEIHILKQFELKTNNNYSTLLNHIYY